MAVEYVKRKDVVEAICNLCRMETDDCLYPRCTIINIVKNIHAADVVERKHGVWLTGLIKDSSGSVRKTFSFCSLCNLSFDRETCFCPNCGAQMDGDSNE